MALPQYLVPGTSSSTLSQGVNSQGQTFYYNFYVSYQFSTYGTFEFSAQEGSGSTFLQTSAYPSTWSASPPPTYSVMFSESGLASGTTWSVDFNGGIESS